MLWLFDFIRAGRWFAPFPIAQKPTTHRATHCRLVRANTLDHPRTSKPVPPTHQLIFNRAADVLGFGLERMTLKKGN